MAYGRSVEYSQRPDGGPIDLDVMKRRSWSGITAQYLRILPPSQYDFRLKDAANYIALHDIVRDDGETAAEGLPRSFARDMRNRLSFAPAGCSIEGWTKTSRPASLIALYIEQNEADRSRIDLSRLGPAIAFDDHMLRSSLLRFQAILHDPALDLPGYAETLGALVTFELSRFGSRVKRAAPHVGGLTPRQLRTVTEYIDGRLTDQLSIAELAGLLDLSRFHFIRAFKQSAGAPPHQFILRKRIELARDLLSQPGLSVTEVATRTGFSGATQLTRTFRRLLGTTPSAYRRDQG